jgi:uncharacterized protein (TIGR04255 family)
MSITFAKAPLVEIIAELRWGRLPPLSVQRNQTITMPLQMAGLDANKLEEFFMRFGGELYQQGFNRAERLVPAGFPLLPFQPVYRYRKSVEADASVLFQAGSGLFSANAIPPYRSWETFAPVVQAGVGALLKTREETEKALPFTSVSLRYIDAFNPELTEGRDIGAFIKDILGITVALPEALTKHIQTGKSVKPNLQFAAPLSNGMLMHTNIGEGLVHNQAAIIMDTTIATTAEVSPDKDAIMTALNSARAVIHEIFFDITKPIEQLMQPTDGG